MALSDRLTGIDRLVDSGFHRLSNLIKDIRGLCSATERAPYLLHMSFSQLSIVHDTHISITPNHHRVEYDMIVGNSMVNT